MFKPLSERGLRLGLRILPLGCSLQTPGDRPPPNSFSPLVNVFFQCLFHSLSPGKPLVCKNKGEGRERTPCPRRMASQDWTSICICSVLPRAPWVGHCCYDYQDTFQTAYLSQISCPGWAHLK